MDPLADPSDVEEVWGDLTVEETRKVEAWIDQASTKLRSMARRRHIDLDSLIAKDALAKNAARDAVVNAVRRVLLNPKALRQSSSTTGPFTESGTIDTSASSGAIYIAATDVVDLFPQERRSGIRSFRIRSGLL
ncbi:Gp19/Gp15/Gp42 family protein [Frigoribacterium sp. VKM Ac-2530]|uniref:Gp19/Gp15/Gp42 family protein n=1 Tax=Frigoribacterium sp. VKM Ac-2530 TaxID=2783822 RepID=UPI00188BB994|nr:Gp19/Gp15/Gp42 family protein [Frigoribacterium sp. VKM Ac-2530]MBF4578955.1 hypothetical protein [Frigoribacterium sp. VKM Ac-2530]